METRFIAICLMKDEEVIKSKKIMVRFSKELEEDLKYYHNVDLKDQIADIVYEEIIDNLKPEDIKELLDEDEGNTK